MVETLTTLIGNLGFPIAAFLLMWYMYYKTVNEFQTSIEELTLAVTTLSNKLDADTVHNNAQTKEQ